MIARASQVDQRLDLADLLDVVVLPVTDIDLDAERLRLLLEPSLLGEEERMAECGQDGADAAGRLALAGGSPTCSGAEPSVSAPEPQPATDQAKKSAESPERIQCQESPPVGAGVSPAEKDGRGRSHSPCPARPRDPPLGRELHEVERQGLLAGVVDAVGARSAWSTSPSRGLPVWSSRRR